MNNRVVFVLVVADSISGGLLFVLLAAVAMTVWACRSDASHAQRAESHDTGFVARSFQAGTRVMPYRLFIPKSYDRRQQYPLVLWLHGVSATGTDNVRQVSGDQFAGTHVWTTPTNQAKHPAFVLAPQSAEYWSSGTATPDLRPDLQTVAGILDALTSEFTIDRRRIYLLGQSMGGSGAWNLVTNAPDRFAATVLVCPTVRDLTYAAHVTRLPLWVFQGEADGMVTTLSRALIAAVNQAGGHPRYTEYHGAGHDIWTRVFSEPEIVDWLFAQSR